MLGCARLPRHPFHTLAIGHKKELINRLEEADNEAKKSFCGISFLFSRLDYKNA